MARDRSSGFDVNLHKRDCWNSCFSSCQTHSNTLAHLLCDLTHGTTRFDAVSQRDNPACAIVRAREQLSCRVFHATTRVIEFAFQRRLITERLVIARHSPHTGASLLETSRLKRLTRDFAATRETLETSQV